MKRPSCPQPARPAGAGTPGPDRGSAPGEAHAAAGFTGSWSLRSAALALAAITFVAYLPVWRAGLIWDDGSFVVNNPLIRQPGGLWQFWFSTRPLDFFPMTSSLLWVEWRLWGASPLSYHVANVCLHLAGTLLLWRLLAAMRIPGAWLAAALFALHPVNVESVAWISEQKNTLCLVFYLLSLLLYVRWDDARESPEDCGRWQADVGGHASFPFPLPGPALYWLSLAAFVLALLSKTAVAPLPLVLLGLAWARRGRIGRADLGRSAPFFVAALAVGLVSLWFQSHRAIGSDVVRTDNFWARLAGAGWAIWFYLGKALLPLDLRAIYPRWQIDPARWGSYLPGLLVAAGFLTCWRWRQRWGRSLLLALGYFVAMLLPVLGFLNISFMQYSLVADRWQYFAIIGPIALGAAALARWRPGKSPAVRNAACLALLSILGLLTWKQCGIYADAETFWQTALTRDATLPIAHNNLGKALYERGRMDEAMGHFQQALEFQPGYAMAEFNLGELLSQLGRLDESIPHFQRALSIQPRYADAHNNLAIAFARTGRLDEALAHFQQAVAIRPDDPEIHNNLGGTLCQKGRTDEGIAHLKRALELDPDYAGARESLAKILQQRGQPVP